MRRKPSLAQRRASLEYAFSLVAFSGARFWKPLLVTFAAFVVVLAAVWGVLAWIAPNEAWSVGVRSFLVGTALGSLLSVLLLFLMVRLKIKRVRIENLKAEFLSLFEVLEAQVRELASYSLTSDPDATRLSAAVETLVANRILHREDAVIFIDLLSMRNEIAHATDESSDIVAVESAIRQAKLISNILESSLAKLTPVSKGQGAKEYELRFTETVRNLVGKSNLKVATDEVFDYLTRLPGGRVDIVLKYVSPPRKLGVNDVLRIVDRSYGNRAGRLIVTNSDLTEDIRAFNSRSDDINPPIEVIQWNSPEDNALLVRALSRLARVVADDSSS